MEAAAPHLSDLELAARLGLAVALCGAIGLEREARGQAAGLRTHILVGVGAALFTLVSAHGFSAFVDPNPAGGFVTTVDPTRITAQIVTGIGFLGAGAIITQGVTVRGLTTAAALWIAAAIGMAAGAGYYLGAVLTTVAVLIALIGFRRLRGGLLLRLRPEVAFLEVEAEEQKRLGRLFEVFAEFEIAVETMDPQEYGFRFQLRIPPESNLDQLGRELSDLEGVRLRALRAARAS